MNKILKNSVFSLTLLLACAGVTPAADNLVPLRFNDPLPSKTTATTMPTSSSKNMSAAAQTAVQPEQQISGNSSLQNAILELDSAQIEVRDDLLNHKTRYSDIDAKYTVLKAERKAVQKQIRFTGRRIKQIDKAKENIRRNML